MSGYAALVSLLQILGTLLDPGRQLIVNNRAQLQSLHEKASFLLDFLDNSSTCKASQRSSLETKMREAAYKAEDAIEFQISWIMDSERRSIRNSMKLTFRYFHYVVFELIVSSNLFPARTEVIPVLILILMLRILIPVVLAVSLCTICAVILHLHIQIYDFPAINDSQELRRVLYDFDIIVKDVVQIKEMSAHAALISLRKILDSKLYSGLLPSCHNRAQLKSLHEKVSFLLDFLGNASSTCMKTQHSAQENLDVTIRDAVYKAKALIEFQIPAQFILDSERRSFHGLIEAYLLDSLPFLAPLSIFLGIIIFGFMNYGPLILASFPQVMPRWIQILLGAFIIIALSLCTCAVVVVLRFFAATNNSGAQENQELRLVIDDFSFIVRNVIMNKHACGNPSDLPEPDAATSSRWDLGGADRNVVVGLQSDMEQIRARLSHEYSSKRELASIVGMGGIGKTTLARLLYNDPHIAYHFDVRAWVTVSQEYSLRHVLLGLLDSAKMLTEQQMQEYKDHELAQCLHQNLFGRRYLIVMDDVWETQIWDSMSTYFPDNDNGSRVLLTSRLSDVAGHLDYSSYLHQMQCLDDNESWNLLCKKVYGGESCPLELESIGRKIAQNCRGLPLAIVVIGSLLYKDNQIKTWKDVAENINSNLRHTEKQCLEILGLSYDHLPHHLRPCFLYMGVFLGDCEIPFSRLIRLWVAEGFLKPCTSKNLEEVAEENLKDLIDRNLVLVCKRSCNGKIRTCSMHSLLRDVSQQKASEENFLHVVHQDGCVTRGETPRRLSMYPSALQVNARHCLISSYHNVRSVLCTSKLFDYHPVVHLGFEYLRVLDILVVHFSKFPDQLIKLVHLRYLAFHYDGPLPPSISKLQNLETIVHHHCSFVKYPLLPRVIWSMPNLRHLYLKPGYYLADPLGFRLPWKSSILQHLQTLMGIRNFKWSKGNIKRIPNLKKLRIWYDVSSSVDWSTYQLESLVDLHQLETLTISIKYDDLGSAISYDPPKLAFPQKLKKLSLSGCGIPWTSMTAIGALPNLEALKLRCEACSGPSWETVEGEFPQLIFLLLEEISFRWWETDAAHFPRLQHLVIRSCGMLEEIPCGIGDIPTLEMIELVDCHPSAVDSAKHIQEEQQSMGNVLKVRIGL